MAISQVKRLGLIFGLLVPSIVVVLKYQSHQTNLWKYAAIILALANLKNLPLVWHFRVFKAISQHLLFQSVDVAPEALFKFIITKSHLPLWEIDYNIHKNNSTYFSDADVARTHLISALLRRGILGIPPKKNQSKPEAAQSTSATEINPNGGLKMSPINALRMSGIDSIADGQATPHKNQGMTEERFKIAIKKPGTHRVVLGSVACFFHREILPYRSYEMWTRLLTWDAKWLYIVTYFVEPGTVRPNDFFLQPSKKSKVSAGNKHQSPQLHQDEMVRIRGKIHATCIATYVLKKGSLTIPPEIVLQENCLLPEKPGDAPSAFAHPDSLFQYDTNSSTKTSSEAGETLNVLLESVFPSSSSVERDTRSWDGVQQERKKGWELVRSYNGLGGLKEQFNADKSVLGVY